MPNPCCVDPAAEKALELLAYTTVKGRPMRIMWANRDASQRKSGVGNVFVKVRHRRCLMSAQTFAFARFVCLENFAPDGVLSLPVKRPYHSMVCRVGHGPAFRC